jgi:glycosyltransferase involved in cell wall biosynthesis
VLLIHTMKDNDNSSKPKIIFFIGRDNYFLSHRLPTARAAIAEGYDVHIIAADSGLGGEIEKQGVTFHPRWFARDTIPLFSTFMGIFQLLVKGISLRACVIQIVGLRYAPAGSFVALMMPRTRFIFSINGLGFLFAKDNPKLFYIALRRAVLSTFSIISRLRQFDIIFQNEDDLKAITSFTKLHRAHIHMIRGSGVDIEYNIPQPLPKSKLIVFGITCRMIKIKGVQDIIIAFRQLIDDGLPVKLVLAGDIDKANPDSLTNEEILAHCRDGEIEWLGHIKHITAFWNACDVAILGSHGGEGLPMALLIPGAMARPILCSDTNGNRDLVENGINGYTFPAGDILAIKSLVKTIIKDNLEELGKESRKLILDKNMDSHSIYQKFRMLYKL